MKEFKNILTGDLPLIQTWTPFCTKCRKAASNCGTNSSAVTGGDLGCRSSWSPVSLQAGPNEWPVILRRRISSASIPCGSTGILVVSALSGQNAFKKLPGVRRLLISPATL